MGGPEQPSSSLNVLGSGRINKNDLIMTGGSGLSKKQSGRNMDSVNSLLDVTVNIVGMVKQSSDSNLAAVGPGMITKNRLESNESIKSGGENLVRAGGLF